MPGRDERGGARRPRPAAAAQADGRRAAVEGPRVQLGPHGRDRLPGRHSCRSRSRATRRPARRSPTPRSPRSRPRRTRRGPPTRCKNTSYADDCLLLAARRPPRSVARGPLPNVPALLLSGRLDMRTPVEDAVQREGAAPEVPARDRPRQRARPGRQRRDRLRRQGAGALHGAPHGRAAVPQHVEPAAADPARAAQRSRRSRRPRRCPATAVARCSPRCARSRTRASRAWRPSTAAGSRAAAGCAAAASPPPTPSPARSRCATTATCRASASAAASPWTAPASAAGSPSAAATPARSTCGRRAPPPARSAGAASPSRSARGASAAQAGADAGAFPEIPRAPAGPATAARAARGALTGFTASPDRG